MPTNSVPYTDGQAYELKLQMQDLPGDADFLIHVGMFLCIALQCIAMYCIAAT